MLASQYGRKESVFTLIDKGTTANTNNTTNNNNTTTTKGADINTKSSKEGLTALMLASKEGHKGTVLTLLSGTTTILLPLLVL